MQFIREARVYRMLFARFFDGVSSGLIMLALPWIMLKKGDNGSLVALIALVCTLASFFLTPIFSTLIDRISRKEILIWMQLLKVSTAGLLLSMSWYQPASILIMAAAQFLFWVSGDIAWTTNNALVQENFDVHEFPKISGYLEVIFQTVTLGAGAVGMLLLEVWGMKNFSMFTLWFSTLSTVFYYLLPYRRKLIVTPASNFKTQLLDTKAIFLRTPDLFMFFALSSLSYPVLTYLVKLVPIFLAEQHYSGQWFALWYSSYGVGALVCGLLITWMLGRYAHEKLMIRSVLVMAVLLLFMSVMNEPLYLIIFILIFGFFNALNRIARMNKLHLVVNINERGRVEGGLKLFTTFSQSLSYVLIALLVHFNITQLGFIIAAMVLAGAGLAMKNYDQQWQRKQQNIQIAVP